MSDVGNLNATACATLVDEWIRCGVRHAVISPGSRNTPITVACAARPELDLRMVHDERVAAFMALGFGLGGSPAIVACTSGTAVANLLPAVVEAGLSQVPMLVVTADRPPELRGVGAPQTIDQVGIFGTATSLAVDAPCPDDDHGHDRWRTLARQLVTAAQHGPVHCNLPLREPLLGTPAALPDPLDVAWSPPSAGDAGTVQTETAVPDDLRFAQRGVFVVGGAAGVELAPVVAAAERLGWPILADPLSGLRDAEPAITAADALLRDTDFAHAHTPHVVVRVGRNHASKVLTRWAASIPTIQIGGPPGYDPDHSVVARCLPEVLDTFTGAANTPWLTRWRHANNKAEAVFDSALAGPELSEPAVARAIATHLPDRAELVVSSSMPVRDLEWFGGCQARAYANRGANGIDGVVSTAVGRALGGGTAVVLVGDLAFLHDANALLALSGSDLDVRIVVVDNGGGGIFNFLPQASELPPTQFERLFGTPHTTDLLALASAHRIAVSDALTLDHLVAALGSAGPSVIRVEVPRVHNTQVHADLHKAVARAIRRP